MTAPTVPALPGPLVLLLGLALLGVARVRGRGRSLLLGAAVLLAGSSAEALTPTAQDRHVYGKHRIRTAFPPVIDVTFEETVSASDDSSFSATTDGAQPGAIIPFPPPFPSVPFTWNDIASQISSIEPEALHASGSSLANPSGSTDVLHEMQSESVYSVDFTLDSEHAFSLTGQSHIAIVNNQYPSPDSALCHFSNVRITLTGPSGVVAEVTQSLPPSEFPPVTCFQGCNVSLPLSASGVLAPGSYRLVARSDSSGTGIFAAHRKCSGSATGDYQADLTLAPTVPLLPSPLVPLLGLVLAAAARRRALR